MLNFEMNGKKMKETVNKVLTVINKKYVGSLTWVAIENVGKDRIKMTAYADEVLLTCYADAWVNTEGKLAIEYDDLKLLTTLTGSICMTETESGIQVKAGKKTLTMAKHPIEECYGYGLKPDMTPVYRMKESVFTDVVKKLSRFVNTDKNNYNHALSTINMNLAEKRFYALDGHRIAWFNMDLEKESDLKNYLIASKTQALLKKVLSAKSNKDVFFMENKKYIQIKTEDFEILQKKMQVEYFDIKRMFDNQYIGTINVETVDLLNIAKYNVALMKQCKDAKVPMLMNICNDSCYTYFNNGKVASFDELEALENTFNTDLMIGLNPIYIKDVCETADSENLLLSFVSEKSAVLVEAENYGYLVLPIHIAKNEKLVTQFKNMIAA